MSTIEFAAYHPIFWLHHCNIDRIYEGFLAKNGIKDSKTEMQYRQRTLSESRAPNRYLQPCAPFKHPINTERDFFPVDAFEIDQLGYRYDKIPTVNDTGDDMQEMPSFAVFMNLKPLDFARSSYTVHLFLVSKEEADSFEVPTDVEEYDKLTNYAGDCNIFGGKGDQCPNCIVRRPFHATIEVTETLRELECEREDVEMIVVVERADSTPVTQKEKDYFPDPVMKGPFFDNDTRSLEKVADQKRDGQVLALQQRLRSVAVTYATNCDLAPVLCCIKRRATAVFGLVALMLMSAYVLCSLRLFPSSGNLVSSRANTTGGLEATHKPQSRNTKSTSV